MGKLARKTSFEQWLFPISTTPMEKLIKIHQLNHYTKKLLMASFLKLLLFAQLNEIESLHVVSDTLFSDDLQKATNSNH